jgi:hypothetical protein
MVLDAHLFDEAGEICILLDQSRLIGERELGRPCVGVALLRGGIGVAVLRGSIGIGVGAVLKGSVGVCSGVVPVTIDDKRWVVGVLRVATRGDLVGLVVHHMNGRGRKWEVS